MIKNDKNMNVKNNVNHIMTNREKNDNSIIIKIKNIDLMIYFIDYETE